MSLDTMLLVGAVVLLVAVLAARLGSGLGLPSLLIFLGVGMLLEPFGIRMDNAELAHSLGFAALVFILGEGGFTTRWSEVRPALAPAVLLATLGVGTSVAATSAFLHLVFGIPVPTAILIGAILAPTDSAAVFSVLRAVPLPGRLRAILEGESGLNDAPIVLLVAIATAWTLGDAPDAGPLGLALDMAVELGGGLLVGAAVGWLGAQLLKRVALPASGLYPLSAMGVVVLAYGAGDALHLSGFAAVYVAAVILGNSDLPHRNATRSFAEGIGWVSQIGLFVMLGMLASPSRITPLVLAEGLALGVFVTFVARPMSVTLSTIWFRIGLREQMFLSWAGLRGAVPIIMATVPMAARSPFADTIFDAVLVYVVTFTLLQAPTLPWIARRLGVAEDDHPVDIEVEVAPLDRIQADFMQVMIPEGSRLHGVMIQELRLPKFTVVALVIRDGHPLQPTQWERLQTGDELLIVVPARRRRQVEDRLRDVGRGGRLVRWLE